MNYGMTSLLRSFRDRIGLGRRRAYWRMLTLFTVIKFVIFLAAIAFAWLLITHPATGLVGLMYAHDESSTNLLSQALLLLVLIQVLDFGASASIAGPYIQVEAPRAYALTLIHAAEARDAAVGQAVPLEQKPAEAAPTGSEIGPLSHPMRTLGMSTGAYVIGIIAALMALAAGVGFLIVSLEPSPYRPHPSLANWIAELAMPCFLLLMGLGGMLWALIARHFARLESRTFTAQVDADGVTFFAPRGTAGGQRFRWSEARAFLLMVTTDTSGYTHEVFVLSDGQREALWEARYDGAAVGEPARVAAHRLAEVVAQRTGQPLMDMTQTIAATLANNTDGRSAAGWGIMARARVIAQAEGDMALANELTRKLTLAAGPLVRLMARLGTRVASPRSLTPIQRAETLRVARALLPYYPTAAELTPNTGRLRMIRLYWNAEFVLQGVILVVAILNAVIAFTIPFGG